MTRLPNGQILPRIEIEKMNVIHKSYSLYHTIDITVESVAVIFAGGLQSSRYEDLAAIYYSRHGAIRQGSGRFRPSERIFVKGGRRMMRIGK